MQPVKVLVSGAAGNIGYAILPMICKGEVFGPNQPIELVLLDITPCLPKLTGVVMELDDCAYPLLKNIIATDDAMVAFKDVKFAFLIGGFPRLKGMVRKDLISKNTAIFSTQGKAIEAVADKNIKVLVVANPANTNALVCMENCPSIPRKNFSAMTRLDYNRSRSLIARKINATLNKEISCSEVKKPIIWGNHSDTQYPDVCHATVDGTPVRELIKDDEYWFGEYLKTVQLRGKAVIEARGASSAFSAANAACDHMHDWVLGSEEGNYVCMGVCSDNNKYGVPEGLIYSFPVTCKDGEWHYVEGLEINEKARELMDLSAKELQEEREAAMEVLKAAN
ncbi:hypothetical protein WA158_006445 [Blastocystis sp. Blastoise]